MDESAFLQDCQKDGNPGSAQMRVDDDLRGRPRGLLEHGQYIL